MYMYILKWVSLSVHIMTYVNRYGCEYILHIYSGHLTVYTKDEKITYNNSSYRWTELVLNRSIISKEIDTKAVLQPRIEPQTS